MDIVTTSEGRVSVSVSHSVTSVSRKRVEILRSKILPDLDTGSNRIIGARAGAYLSLALDYRHGMRADERGKAQKKFHGNFIVTVNVFLYNWSVTDDQ